MAWPTAHRNGGALARQGGGFQTRGFQPRSTPYSPIRTPLGPPPVPGNDNLPWRPPPPAGLPFGKRGGGGGKGGGGGLLQAMGVGAFLRPMLPTGMGLGGMLGAGYGFRELVQADQC